MSDIKIKFAEGRKNGAVLKVIGVGGGGGNAINRMIEEGLKGVGFVAVNTDAQDLADIKEPGLKIQIGEKLTKGLGTGSNAEIGMQAALEDTDELINMLEGADMVFITAGMGGGTGTGASQAIANHASSLGILTVAVVTKPFEFEGTNRMEVAEGGIDSLLKSVDSIITIPNEKLFEIEDDDMTTEQAFRKVDEILLKAVRGISDIINTHGQNNVDFADVKAVMLQKGLTLMGTGEAKGENRAEEAARKALSSPLLDNISIKGASGVLYNITGASVGLKELRTIAQIITEQVSPDVRAKFGIVKDESMKESIRVTVIATGVTENKTGQQISDSIRDKRFTDPPKKVFADTTRSGDFFTKKEEQTDLFNRNESVSSSGLNTYSMETQRTLGEEDLTPINNGYVNEHNLPNLAYTPDNDDVMEIDIPVFQRGRLTKKSR